jgi:hypothetical protein
VLVNSKVQVGEGWACGTAHGETEDLAVQSGSSKRSIGEEQKKASW